MLQRLFGRLRREKLVTAGRYQHGNTHLLEVRDVVKAYAGPAGTVQALKGVSLQADRGEFVAVVGKSGSGKSTLMNMITGVDRPTSGTVFIGDTAMHTLSEQQLTVWRGKNVGIVYQAFLLIPTLTVLENVMLPMDVCNTYPPDAFRQRALHLLEQVEMTEHVNKLPAATSGGQQQRVAIARALANDPPLLVADEPTGSLDTKTADMVIRIFEKLAAQGKTILMVTHDNELAQRAQRRITIADGLIVAGEQAAAPEEESQEPAEDPLPTPVDKPVVSVV
ncbi:MAG: ABC transporter ATP-binding protein [Chloroflexaceae bacterium]